MTEPNPTNGMQALAEYGYVMHPDGVLRPTKRPNSQRWKPVEGGFLRYDMQSGVEVPMPYGLLPEFRKVSGLDYRLNPNCFTWLWPESEIAKIYIEAKRSEDANRRTDKDAPAERPRVDEPVTEPQLEAMLEAQEPEPVEQPRRRWWR